MTKRSIASREEWLAARKALLAKEKQVTRLTVKAAVAMMGKAGLGHAAPPEPFAPS